MRSKTSQAGKVEHWFVQVHMGQSGRSYPCLILLLEVCLNYPSGFWISMPIYQSIYLYLATSNNYIIT